MAVLKLTAADRAAWLDGWAQRQAAITCDRDFPLDAEAAWEKRLAEVGAGAAEEKGQKTERT